jgi:hypothetical protein
MRSTVGSSSRFASALIAALVLVGCSSGGSGTGTGGSTGTPGVAGSGSGEGGTTGAAGSGPAGHGGPGGGPGGAAAGSSGAAGASGGSTGQAGGGVAGSGHGGASSAGNGGSVANGGSKAGSGGGSTAGSGGLAASGGAGGTASGPVTPAKVGSRYQFSFGDVVFEIDPTDGGRVSKLALSGTDLIVSSGTDPTTWGSVFWTSPRSDWTPTTNDWPPPSAIDSAAYTASVSGTHVVVTGMADSMLNVNMVKDYAADTSGWINIKYTIDASKARKAAPWEVSRVPRGGIVFFPTGTGTLTQGPFTVTQANGIAWIDDGPKTATSPNGDKCYGDGAGWEAYVLNGNLFLKKFTDQPANGGLPSGEGEVDVYPGDGFIEFEVEGPYTQIAANSSLSWSMQWKAVKVPSSVTVAVGSSTLVDFAKQQLGL